ncbi:MAG TPA: methyltransferase domain-containing protein [Candidatus Saccharimonadales bacterium]|nr:methyltransferase domain-containing protein [Candidatus Saccharimonadales bacterium]
MHLNSVLLFRQHLLPLFTPGAHVLELGPDGDPSTYQREVTAPVVWSTADLASEVDARGERLWGSGSGTGLTYRMTSEYEIEAPDATFDIVVSGQVIEHVRKPWLWLRELARVCRPGGLVLTVNPVSWPYHEAPIDCWRIYPEGMRALCEDAGLVVELSLFESLEQRPLAWYPGRSYNAGRGPRGRALNRLKAMTGYPLTIAFDTVTIARKPAPSAAPARQ